MSISLQREAFDEWLSKNQKLFRHPPVTIKNRKDYFTMCFQGINPAIECIITTYDYSIYVKYKRECWDSIDEEYVCEQQTPSGKYFCKECSKTKRKKLFPTRLALWEDHIFKPILKWTNNNFLKTKWVCLFQYGSESSTSAKVVDTNSLLKEMQDDNFVKAISLMESQVMPIQKSDNISTKRKERK